MEEDESKTHWSISNLASSIIIKYTLKAKSHWAPKCMHHLSSSKHAQHLIFREDACAYICMYIIT